MPFPYILYCLKFIKVSEIGYGALNTWQRKCKTMASSVTFYHGRNEGTSCQTLMMGHRGCMFQEMRSPVSRELSCVLRITLVDTIVRSRLRMAIWLLQRLMVAEVQSWSARRLELRGVNQLTWHRIVWSWDWCLKFASKPSLKSSSHNASGKRYQLLHTDHTEWDLMYEGLQIGNKQGFNNVRAKI